MITFDSFPRMMGIPNQFIVNSHQEFLDIIDKYNTRKDLFTSIYSKKGNTYIIDKIFYDFDGYESQPAVRHLVRNLIKDNYTFELRLSGGGFHVYVEIVNRKIDQKEYIKSSQLYLLNKYEIKDWCDPHVIGDLSRLCRIINTYNTRRGVYCIPLYSGEIELSIEHILNIAKNPRYIDDHQYIGFPLDYINSLYLEKENLYKLRNIPKKYKPQPNRKLKFDIPTKVIINIQCSDDISEYQITGHPLCVKDILNKSNPTHDERFFLTLYLSDRFRKHVPIENVNIDNLITRIINYMRTLNWDDYNEDLGTSKSTTYQVNNIINKMYNKVPNCQWRRKRGICNDECKYA